MNLKKDITFIYMDSTEKSFMQLLAEEAKNRGYITKITNNKFEKCEIGVYCQHINFPQYSKFSIIMLHDIIQQYGNWPDIWYREPWNKYDIGILPSKQWVENWGKCSQWKYTRPRVGMFLVGWPKADKVAQIKKEEYKRQFYQKYNLDLNKKTVLYAPAWENDYKEDDFVKAMLKLDVNILIKQWEADAKYFPEQVANVKEMEELHKHIEQVTILPPEMNIFEAILASDILVSEESSTMSEAAMLGIPAISVSNWLIPDTKPKRFPKCSYDFVVKTYKENLKDCVSEILSNYPRYKRETETYAQNNFSNIGNTCKMILDIVDDCIAETTIRYKPITPNALQKVPFLKNIKRIAGQIYREMYANWKIQNPIFRVIWNIGKNIKNILVKR